jgi:hypothetical protein
MKTYIKEFEYNPTEEEQDALDYLASPHFPLYYQNSTSSKYKNYSHVLMYRHEHGWPVEGHINSKYYDSIKDFFLQICDENDIKVETILRAAVNNVPHHPGGCGDIHFDHDFPHFNFVYHITDTDSPTNLYDENNTLIHQSVPKKNHVTIFSKMPHSITWPKPFEQRITLVFTFLGQVK